MQQILKFKDLDEVIERANRTHYGLGAAVFTKDINKAITIANSIKAGTVWWVRNLLPSLIIKDVNVLTPTPILIPTPLNKKKLTPLTPDSDSGSDSKQKFWFWSGFRLQLSKKVDCGSDSDFNQSKMESTPTLESELLIFANSIKIGTVWWVTFSYRHP